MANDKVVLSLKQVDGNTEQSSLNLSYVNPDATKTQLLAFAEQTLALSDDTLVSAQRVEYKDLTSSKRARNFYIALDSGQPNWQQELTYTFANINPSGVTFPGRPLMFTYDGDGVPYVKSCTAFVAMTPVFYIGSESNYPHMELMQGQGLYNPADSPYYDNFKVWNDAEHTISTVAGDVVIALPETDDYEAAEVVIHITA